jgi:hypothetical protein
MTPRSALLLLALAAATPAVRYFHYTRPVLTPPAQSGQTCVTLDPQVFSQSGPDLASLRLYQGTQIHPYVISTDATLQSPPHTITPLNLGLRNNDVAFDAAMPSGPYSDISLAVSGKDFIATVRVTGSQSQSGPATALGSYTIFDFTRQKLGRSTILHLPPSDFRYLHFRISGPLQPAQITSLSTSGLNASAPQYVTVASTPDVTQNGRDSILTFNLPPNIPVDRVRFSTGPQPLNFSRQVTIKVSPTTPSVESDDTAAPFTTQGALLRIHTTQNGRKIDEEQLTISAPPYIPASSTGTTWTITVHNLDDPPLDIRSVSLQMIARNLCFDAAPSNTYTLYYGDPALSPPHYDYATLFALNKKAARASLGPEQLNPLYTPRPDTRPFTEKHPALLWIALLAAILLLGLIALRSARRLKQ